MNDKRLFFVLFAVLLLTLTARAASEPRILQKRLDPDTSQWTLYVRHSGEVRAESVSAGGVEVENAVLTRDPAKTPLVTWILFDNSADMPEEVRGKASDLLLTLLGEKGRGEVHTFCTFSDRLRVKVRESGSFSELKQQIDALEYDGEEANLVSALNEVLASEDVRTGTEFARVILISAGGARVPSGTDTRLLQNKLQANNIPIYTVGCKTDDNADILSWMYALSERTYARSWDIDEIGAADIANIMHWEEIPVRVFLTLPEGGDVEVTFSDGAAARASLPATAIPTETETPPQPDSEPSRDTDGLSAWGPVLFVVLLFVGAGAAFWMSGGRKKRKPAPPANLRGENTLLTLYLKDADNLEREVSAPLRGRVTIGRSDENMIVLDYDQSISRTHCEICFQNGALWVLDSDSSGGTYVNGERVENAAIIPPGATVRLGHVNFHVET